MPSSPALTLTSKLPAVDLPPDVLFIIAQLAYPDPDQYIEPEDTGSHGSFISLTRVCRHWRNALFSFPTFWTRIHVPHGSVEDLQELLTISATLPLHVIVYLSHPPPIMTHHFNVLFSHIHRIKSLIIREQRRSQYDKEYDYIIPFISKPAPLLETFHFDFFETINDKTTSRGSIPEALFTDESAQAPNVKELHISCMNLSPAMPVFKNIKRLSLKHVYGLPSLYDLFDVLEAASSNLEALELVFPTDSRWGYRHPDLHDAFVIQLPFLKTLLLDIGPAALMNVLHFMEVPSNINWDIDCDNLVSFSNLHTTPLLSFLERSLKDVDDPHAIVAVGYQDLYIRFGHNPSDRASLKLRMPTTEARIDHLHAIANICLSEITSCELICLQEGRYPQWLETLEGIYSPSGVFSLLPRVEKLSIACHNSSQLWKFIYRLRPRRNGEVIPCRRLSNLKVGLVDTTGQTLLNILSARKEAGQGIKHLYVEYDKYARVSNFKPAFMEIIEEVEMIRRGE